MQEEIRGCDFGLRAAKSIFELKHRKINIAALKFILTKKEEINPDILVQSNINLAVATQKSES